MISLVKMCLKLLLRNKGFLFFLIATPLLSTVILNIKMDSAIYHDNENKEAILELKDYKQKAVYSSNTSAFIIKVYDASNSKLSEFVLNKIAKNSMFSVCRADVSELTDEKVYEQAKKDAFDDRAGVLLYLKKDFDKAVLSGEFKQGIKLYCVSEDEREELFITELSDLFTRMDNVLAKVNNDSSEMIKYFETIDNNLPKKEHKTIAGTKDISLNNKQINQHSQIGYAFAIITIGFLFGGLCIAHMVIEEQNNRVFTRIMLTKSNARNYFVSKFIVAFAISVLQTVILGVCLAFIPKLDIGINIISFLFVVFLLGLIFSTLSLLLGVVLGDVMSSNYAVFTIWNISSLLAGLYFPLDETSDFLKTLSYISPHRWFMDGCKLLLVGDKSAYSMLLCVTVAFLIVIISVGAVGLKIKKYE